MQIQILPVETRFVRASLVYFFVGVSLAAACQAFLYGDLVDFVGQNSMSVGTRSRLLALMGAGGVAAVLMPCAILLSRTASEGLDRFTRLAGMLSPLLLSFMLPLLFDWRVFAKNEWACVLAVLLFGIGLERSLRVCFGSIDWTQPSVWYRRLSRTRIWRSLPLILVSVGALLVGLYFAYFTILQHYRMATTSWDLAIFDNMMWNLIRGKWFKASPDLGRTGSHLQYHATFIAYLFAPFYALWQRPETLLAMQALITSAAAIPIYLLTKVRTGSPWIGVALAYAYLVHSPMHGPLFYDFHFLTTAPFWVSWVLYFFETDRRRALVVSWILAVLVREEISAGLAMASLFYLAAGRRVRWALVGGSLSALYFVTMKFYVMPLHRTLSGMHSFTWMYQGLLPSGENGFGGVLRTIGSNPVFAFNSLLDIEKLTYVIKTLGPLLLLPLRHPTTWILLLPASIFTLLSTGYKPLYQTVFQYTSNYTCYLFFASAVTLGWWHARDRLNGELRRFRGPAAAVAIVVTATCYSYHFGAIFQHNSFRGGFRQVQFYRTSQEARRYDELQHLIALIPKNASVAATEAEAPHVSNREDCFTLRFFHQDADYLLINLDEARGGSTQDIVASAIATEKYGYVTSRGRVALWKRGGDQSNNKEGLRQLRLPTKRTKTKPPARMP